MLNNAPRMKDAVILAYEWPLNLNSLGDEHLDDFVVELSFTFARSTFQETFQAVAEELRGLIETATAESALIADDNLNRGTLVRIGSAILTYDDRIGWTADTSGLRTPSGDDDPSEFWGERPFWGRDLLTDTPSYPWMRVLVANEPYA
jgi:hypothetical protein